MAASSTVSRVALRFPSRAERWSADAFVFALLATVVVFARLPVAAVLLAVLGTTLREPLRGVPWRRRRRRGRVRAPSARSTCASPGREGWPGVRQTAGRP